ncbi:glycosyltransferase [Parapedobacter sp. 10938]|uniref:glycosyltransferase n=1 Tax=Parapedobacter flavus TaxID=3110225 RepID=UPI002DC01AE5|nr:glycosyltransferase [Parapedobacter sp. 10938]MEC3879896.1 glycosyltransferase [Parapedobacter sp. 10938]
MTQGLYILWVIIQLIIGINLVSPIMLLILYWLFPKRNRATARRDSGDYAIIVTAYEQTSMLPAVIKSILSIRYSRYLVYVVADKCDTSDLCFDDERVILLKPEKVLASNTRSHFYAINRFKRQHNRLTIIDSDNLLDPEYLNELDRYFDQGFEAVQGVRKAKNMDGVYAGLDAARDIYYHFYDGKALFHAGSSATLAGSGMAFTVDLYEACLAHLDIVGAGFDKVLQYEIVKRGKQIAYADEAVVYDEKTAYSAQLVNQRARWINTWFKYFTFGFGLVGRGIRTLSRNQLLFGLTLLRPPLFIFLLLSFMFMVANLFINQMHAVVWLIALGIFVAGFFTALVVSQTDRKVYRALVGIPLFIFYQLTSLIKARKANKISVATRHYQEKHVQDVE